MLNFSFIKSYTIFTLASILFFLVCRKDYNPLESNPVEDPSEINITFPEDNCKVYGIVEILCIAYNKSGIRCVELWIDGQKSTICAWNQPFVLTWNTYTYDNDSRHTLFARAYNWDGTYNDSEPIEYIVNNSNYQRILFRSERESRSDIYIMNIDGTYQHNISRNLNSSDYSAQLFDNGEKILFDAYRNDNHDIYIMDINGENQINISNHDRTERGSRISPTDSLIYFFSDRDKDWGNFDIYSMELDGSNQKNLTNDTSAINYFAISNDGQKILYSSKVDSTYGIIIMNKDGLNKKILVSTPGNDYEPKFSPDGNLVVFQSNLDNSSEIYSANIDGSNLRNLSQNPALDLHPKFSPDGDKILFISRRNYNYNIFVMNTDGTEQINLSNFNDSDSRPRFTKDGSQIIFQRNLHWYSGWEIFIMNADGSNQINLTNNTFYDGF